MLFRQPGSCVPVSITFHKQLAQTIVSPVVLSNGGSCQTISVILGTELHSVCLGSLPSADENLSFSPVERMAGRPATSWITDGILGLASFLRSESCNFTTCELEWMRGVTNSCLRCSSRHVGRSTSLNYVCTFLEGEIFPLASSLYCRTRGH